MAHFCARYAEKVGMIVLVTAVGRGCGLYGSVQQVNPTDATEREKKCCDIAGKATVRCVHLVIDLNTPDHNSWVVFTDFDRSYAFSPHMEERRRR